jgi:hypothetical protein
VPVRCLRSYNIMPSISKQIKRSKLASCLDCTDCISPLSEDEDDSSIFFLSSHLSDRGLARITHGLELSKCYKLYLCGNNISARGAMLISTVIQSSHNIVELSLANNCIGDVGAEHISVALMNNKVLRMLNLENNGIGCKGANSLAKALSFPSSLRWLVLSENMITDEGVKAFLNNCVRNTQSIVTLIESNHTLFSVVLKKVHLKDRTILRDLQHYLTINRICHSYSNGLAIAIKRKIKICVHENPSLLLDYIVNAQSQECFRHNAMMLKLQPELFSFFGDRLTTLYTVLRQYPFRCSC